MRQATIRALEIRDEADIIRGLTRGELEARILDAERAQATAPPEVSRQLRLTAQAEADAWQQAADAATRHDHAQAASAQALASQIAAERQQLEAVNDPLRGMVRRHHRHQGNGRQGQGRAGTPRTRPAASRTAAARARKRTR